MPDPWVFVSAGAAGVIGLGFFLWRCRRPSPGAGTPLPDTRETRLARGLARMVDCAVPGALPAVRRELGIAPGQSDEVLLKRAAYHYRQDEPEKACPVYRDSPG